MFTSWCSLVPTQYVEFRPTLKNMFCLQESRYPMKNNHQHSHFQEKLMSALDSNGTQEWGEGEEEEPQPREDELFIYCGPLNLLSQSHTTFFYDWYPWKTRKKFHSLLWGTQSHFNLVEWMCICMGFFSPRPYTFDTYTVLASQLVFTCGTTYWSLHPAPWRWQS